MESTITCSLCKDPIEDEKYVAVLNRSWINEGADTHICGLCENALKDAFVRCGCSYDHVERECPDKACKYHKNHADGCEYHRCNDCVYGVCDCGYSSSNDSCRGQRCRRYIEDGGQHTANCEYWRCEACVPAEYGSD